MKLHFQIGQNFYEIKDMTLSQHYAVQQELKLNPKPQVAIISMLSGCPTDELYGLDLDQFVDLWIHFEQYYYETATTSEAPPKKINIEGREFGLLDLQKMKIGEFADLDITITSADSDNKIHEILSVIYRPIIGEDEFGHVIEPYDGDKSRKRSREFLKLDLPTAMKGLNFFLNIGKEYLNSTLNSLKQMMEEEKDPWIKESFALILKQMPEDGSMLWRSSPMKMSWSWTERRNSLSTQLSTGWPGLKTSEKNKKQNYSAYKNYELITDGYK